MISLDGKVHDPNRIDFLARYLQELKKAAEEVDIRGYFQWSLMDNFEWAKGYSDRFGLVYGDYRNQQRIMKDSAFWYKHVMALWLCFMGVGTKAAFCFRGMEGRQL